VAERWGSMEADGGKVVWALLDRVPSEPDADVSRDPSRSRTA
jgi:hypothetical protein